ncbi:GtrA family protein [Clostridium beijerinckii]|uniref:GtrA family protein n=1 Tax=Clostridium beijerinckii TaxID=1520 RepID=UPI00047E94F9|nr:GtrA family protein [Clostridium beijerinckii]
MDNIVQKFKNTFYTKEFITFLIIGVINTFNGTAFSYLYSSFLNENIAFIVGYISGLIISYLLNSFITFKERLQFNKFIKFVISYIPNFIIQNIVVVIVFNLLGLNKLIAYLLAAIIGIPITFILMKFFAFNKKIN